MKNYAGMSVERSIAEFAYDEGMAQLREEAVDKIASRLFKEAVDNKVMPNGDAVGDFLCGEPKMAELLNEFNFLHLDGEENDKAWDRLHTLAYDLIANECNQAAEDEVDGN